MPVSKVLSLAISGVDAFPVTVEVDTRKGVPSYTTVGLPDKAVSESKNRISAAIKNSGYPLPPKKITVNLAPAGIKKEGSSFDFPIALGILSSIGEIEKQSLEGAGFVGELSLDGSLRKISGALPIAFRMKKMGMRRLLLPEDNSREASVVSGLEIIPVSSLRDAVEFLGGEKQIEPCTFDKEEDLKGPVNEVDFSDIRGQYFAKRAFEIAAAGGHNLIMCGPPGSGKTMLARRLVTILPPMTMEEAVEVSVIHSVAGGLPPGKALCTSRPFRSPHHTSSDIALVGGGSIPRPGEVTLAHRGVLFLDEFPEFKRKVIEVIRQPLEEGFITVSRAQETVTYPARFMLVAAMNPCPCGYSSSPSRKCACTQSMILKYRAKVSGPVMDRIDIHLDISPVKREDMEKMEPGEPSGVIKRRVSEARSRQNSRYESLPGVFCNADLDGSRVEKHCGIDREAKALLGAAVGRFGLSARGYTKVLKVARTIADLDRSGGVGEEHAAEALQYRVFSQGRFEG